MLAKPRDDMLATVVEEPEGVISVSERHAAPALSTAPVEPNITTRPSRWSGGRIAGLVLGVLLVLVALILLAAGGTGLWADRTQRDGGYVTTDVHAFSISGSALATEPTRLGAAGIGWLYSPGLLGKVRIRVTPGNPRAPLFVGIGRSADVDRYLAGVNRTVVTDFFADKLEAVAGGPARSAPGAQRFWVASSAGAGTRTVLWKPSNGSWDVVVMNADARPGIDVRAELGARMPAVLWIAVGVTAAGALFLAGGGLLIASAVRGRRGSRASEV
jgi:hypothetical protein